MENTKTVLVGVTDIFFYTKIRDAFRPAGYALKRVTSSGSVAEQVAALAPVAMVLNMNDPGFDAANTLRAVKDDPACQRLPVLAFANHEEVDTWRQARALGIDKIVSRNEFSARTLPLLEEVILSPLPLGEEGQGEGRNV